MSRKSTSVAASTATLALRRKIAGHRPSPGSAQIAPLQRRSIVHAMSLALVWLTMFAGAFVAIEPAPADALMLGLIVLLPVVGLTAINAAHILYLVGWMAIVSAGLVAIGAAINTETAITHMIVSLYLCIASFIVAAFVAQRPEPHSRLILGGYTAAAVSASLMGIIGYFDLIPGTRELFTLHSRATGLFKDPNVYAPFLIPPAIYLLNALLTRGPGKCILAALGLGIVGLAILLSFSRGGWVNLAVAALVYLYFAFATSRTDRQRLKIVVLASLTCLLMLVLVAVALESDQVSRLFAERASMSQHYDEGPDGRFGGQLKALALILENPLGLGALQFGGFYNREHAHNVYISMFVNAGWVGGIVHIGLIVATIFLGARALLARRWPTRYLLVLYAAFIGMVVEGLVIETDHWRHFYLVTGMLWGAMFPSQSIRRASRITAQLPPAIAMLPKRAPRRPARILGLGAPVSSGIVLCKLRTRQRRSPKRAARILRYH